MRVTDRDGHRHVAEITTGSNLSGFGIPVLVFCHPLEEEPEALTNEEAQGWAVVEATGEELAALALGGYEEILREKGPRIRPLVADYVRARRRELGLTQKELAGQLGASRVSVTRWESGEHVPSTDYLDALSKL